MTITRPKTLPTKWHDVPPALVLGTNWVGYKLELRDGKWTKPPYQLDGRTKAESDNPATWASLDAVQEACERRVVDGGGYVLPPEGGIAFVDLDHCRDPESGVVDAWAQRIVAMFDGAYIEISPSGTGFKILGYARLPKGINGKVFSVPGAQPDAQIEIYGSRKYTTVTAHRTPGSASDLTDIQGPLDTLYAELFPPRDKKQDKRSSAAPTTSGVGSVGDDMILYMARHAENGTKFRKLYDHGDLSDYEGDASRADAGLVSMLAFWCDGDRHRIDHLFRGSKLYREKWDGKRGENTYGWFTIDNMLAEQTEFYGWQQQKNGSTEGSGPTDAVESWPDLQPLPPATSVPTLPAELVCEPFRPWIVDVAEVNRIPMEMVAMPAMVTLGSVVGRAVGVRPWNYNDHTVVPNLWGLVVTPPGWMKTSAVGEALKPIGRLAAAERESYEARRDVAAAEVAALEAVLEDIKRRMREAAKKGETLDTLKEQFAEKTRDLRELKVTERRYITHDATIEKLAELLIENPRGMLVARDEVYGLLRSFEKSGHENDRQFYLEGWSGTGSFTTDRIGRGTLHIPAVTLSIIGGIQPGRLRNLIDEAASGGGGDDGLLQRFQLTVWPDRLEPWEKPTRWPDSSARERAFTIFKAIDELRPLGLSLERDGPQDVPYLQFTPFAQRAADEWREALEHRLRSDEFDNAPAFASHLAKYRSLMPSLALLFHLIDIAAGATKPGPINEGPTHRAAAWCDFLEAHARKVYDVEIDRGKRAARSLASKIKAGNIIDGETVRDIYRNQWSGLKTDEIVSDGLAVLESLGWIRLESVSTPGRAKQVVRLHPDLRKDGTR